MVKLRIFYTLSAVLFVLLQYSIFFSNNSLFSYLDYKKQLTGKINQINKLEQESKKLSQTILDLNKNQMVLESYAREKFGYIKNDETYVQIIKNVQEDN